MQRIEFENSYYLRLGEQPLSGSTFTNWIRVLKDNHFKIDWQFIPKAIYVTSMISVMTPFRIYEKILYDKKINEASATNPLFIIGHFRSGTTFLHYLLGQDPSLGYVSTFETMAPSMIIANEQKFKNIVKNHLPTKRPMDDLEMNANLPYEEEYAIANTSPYSFYHGWYFPRNLKKYFDEYVLFKNVSETKINAWKMKYKYFLKKISYKNNGNMILLKSLVNTARIKLLLDIYPDAKFIHIYRNPLKVYLSTWKLYKKMLPLFAFQHISSETLDEYILYCYKELFKKYFNEKHLIPKENLIEFKYEDFIKNPLGMIDKTYQYLDLQEFDKAKPEFIKYIKKHENYQPDKYEMDDSIRSKIYDKWKFAFDKFGY